MFCLVQVGEVTEGLLRVSYPAGWQLLPFPPRPMSTQGPYELQLHSPSMLPRSAEFPVGKEKRCKPVLPEPQR